MASSHGPAVRRSRACSTARCARCAGCTVLVVGHGGVTRILASHYLGILPKLDATAQTNTAITEIVVDDDGGRVARLFASDHIADARR